MFLLATPGKNLIATICLAGIGIGFSQRSVGVGNDATVEVWGMITLPLLPDMRAQG